MPVKTVGEIIAGRGKQDSAIDQVAKLASTVSTLQQIQLAPAKAEGQRLQNELRRNELVMTQINNERARVDLIAAQRNEQRAQTKFLTDQFKALPGLFAQNFELGNAVATRMGLGSAKNEDGTVTLAIPTRDGSTKGFTLDVNRIADPEKRAKITADLRGEYNKDERVKNLKIINKSHKDITDAAALTSGIGDLTMIVSYVRMIDPGSVAREGEVNIQKALAAGVPRQIVNWYEQQKRMGDNPIFGEPGSPTRANFLNAAGALLANSQDDVKPWAEVMASAADAQGLDPKLVVTETGGLDFDALIGTPEEPQSITPDQLANQFPQLPEKGGSVNAGVPGGPAPAPKQYQKLKLETPEQRENSLQGLLNNMFQVPGGQ